MLFNSLHFAAFFPLAVLSYYLTAPTKRWRVLLISSYYFYMAWEPAYALLILFSTSVDYLAAVRMEEAADPAKKRRWLWASLGANLGMLFFFKYFNFAVESVDGLLGRAGIDWQEPALRLLLPVGISFYTFQSLSYTLDVYWGRVRAERHFGYFATYVVYWPQLVAGPIERPSQLLPQLHAEHTFDLERLREGLVRMAWGFWKKLVVADRLAPYVEQVYADPAQHGGGALLLATYLFAFQIYCDFSAYSDIALGAARVLGVDLMENFRRPYAAASIGEFWSRWHISLSTFFRDYVYIPLGGNRRHERRNLLITFLVSGLWHGASWTFVVWGALHGLYLIVGRATAGARATFRAAIGLSRLPALERFLATLITFHMVLVGWVFFRAPDLGEALGILGAIVRAPLDTTGWPELSGTAGLVVGLAAILALGVHEALTGDSRFFDRLPRWPAWQRWSWYLAIVLAILWFGVFSSQAFIYFQF